MSTLRDQLLASIALEERRTAGTMTDDDKIAEAVACGKVKRFPMGATSEWDDRPFREKRAMLLPRARGLRGKKSPQSKESQ